MQTKNIQLLKPKGRLVMINTMKGKMANIDLLQVLSKQLVITGSTLRPQTVAYKSIIAGRLLKINLATYTFPHPACYL